MPAPPVGDFESGPKSVGVAVDTEPSGCAEGMCSLAIPAEKLWDDDDRPKGWQGRVYGLVVHPTGSGLPTKARRRGVDHTLQAVAYYSRSHGCHYVNGWQGMAGGDLLQLANEREQAHGVGVTNRDDPLEGPATVDRGRSIRGRPAQGASYATGGPAGRVWAHSLELLPARGP